MRSTGGVFEAKVTYGSACLADTALGVQMNRKNLLRAQRAALLTVTKAYTTTSALALPLIAGVLPIGLLAIRLFTIAGLRELGSYGRQGKHGLSPWRGGNTAGTQAQRDAGHTRYGQM